MSDTSGKDASTGSLTSIDAIMEKVDRETRSMPVDDCEFKMDDPNDLANVTLSWKSPAGVDKSLKVNLDLHIGNVGGQLVWGGEDFSMSCKETTLDKTVLVTKCRCHFSDSMLLHDKGGEELYIERRLDLKDHIIYDKALEGFNVVSADSQFSRVISSAKWMKYAIITQPDMGSFLSEKAVQDAVSGVAERTVAQVMHQTEQVLAEVVKVALDMIKQKAKDHIANELKRLIKTAALSTAYSSGLGEFEQMEEAHRMAYNAIAPHMGAFKSLLPPGGTQQP